MLEIKDLTLVAANGKNIRKLVHEVNLSIQPGEVTALVGESGAGKTLTGLSVLNLLPPTIFRQSGTILFRGIDLSSLPPRELHRYRGRRIAYIPQEPASALDPLMRIGDQLREGMAYHLDLEGSKLRNEMTRLLRQVELSNPDEVLAQFPHQLSGGMRQRVLIAIALSCRPDLIIADEITSSIDLITRNRLLKLLAMLRDHRELAMLLITHDLFVAERLAAQITVMRNGQILESGSAADILTQPNHPYTCGLIHASGVLEGGRNGYALRPRA